MAKFNASRLTFCFLFLLLAAEHASALRPSLSNIKKHMSAAGKNVDAQIKKISDFLGAAGNSSLSKDLATSVDIAGRAIPKITSGQTYAIVTGVLDLMSAGTALIPKVGPVLGSFFSLVSTIVNVVGGSSTSMASIVKREIEKALKDYEDSELRAEAAGAMRAYRISQAYLTRDEENGPPNEHEVAALAGNIPVYQGVNFLGYLMAKINQNSMSDNPEQVRRAMEYIELYITLAVMRSAILFEMYSFVRSAPNSDVTANSLNNVLQAEMAEEKTILEFLTKPDYYRAVFFAYFNPTDWPVTIDYLGRQGLKYQQLGWLATGYHSLTPQRWPNWYMHMGAGAMGVIAGSKSLSSRSQFIFDTINSTNNVFFIRNKRRPNMYVYMTNTRQAWLRSSGSPPGPEGEWKVVKFEDGRYMLSPVRWPNWFIYMKHDAFGCIWGHKVDKGEQSHWNIN